VQHRCHRANRARTRAAEWPEDTYTATNESTAADGCRSYQRKIGAMGLANVVSRQQDGLLLRAMAAPADVLFAAPGGSGSMREEILSSGVGPALCHISAWPFSLAVPGCAPRLHPCTNEKGSLEPLCAAAMNKKALLLLKPA
jgi:hypothetical protein